MNDKKSEKRLYSIHSQKGGVGKTSIAIAIAGLAAITNNKKTIIIDADLTGTSLIDIEGWENKDINNKLLLNDLIIATPHSFRNKLNNFKKYFNKKKLGNKNAELICSVPFHNNIDFLPASSSYEDIKKIIPLISQEDYLNYLKFRLEDIVSVLFNYYDVIIIDNPPGLFGISLASLRIVFDNEFINDKINYNQIILITTPDSMDFKALFSSYSNIEEVKELLKNIKEPEDVELFIDKSDSNIPNLILNKFSITSAPNAEVKIGVFDPAFIMDYIIEKILKSPLLANINKVLMDVIKKKSGKKKALVAPLVNDFNIINILDTIKNVSENIDENVKGEFQDWVKLIAKSVDLEHIKNY